MVRRRVGAALATTLVGTIVMLTGFAWACTNFIRIDSVMPASDAPAGSAVAVVTGSGAAAGAPVELRWNSVTGPVIGRAQADPAGGFSLRAPLPDVAAGVYTLVASDGHNPVGRAPVQMGATADGAFSTPGPATNFTPAAPSARFGLPTLGSARGIGLAALAGGMVLLASGALVLTTRSRRALAVG